MKDLGQKLKSSFRTCRGGEGVDNGWGVGGGGTDGTAIMN